MKKVIRTALVIFCFMIFSLFTACGSVDSDSSSSERQKLEPLDFIDYSLAEIPIWANRPYVPNSGIYKQTDRGENISLNLTAAGETRTAYKKIVHDCKNVYTGNISKHIFFCVHTKWQKEELISLQKQGYNTIAFYLYLEAEGMPAGTLDMMRGTFRNARPTINSVSFLIYMKSWNRVEYPLKWFVDDYEQLNGQKLFLYPYQEKLMSTVYSFYFGKMTLEKI